MTKRLIYADEAKSALTGWETDPTDEEIEFTIDRIRSVDAVEVKRGYWYLLDECANAGVYCSVCTKKVYKEHYANQKLKSKYCPNCGARMDAERRPTPVYIDDEKTESGLLEED